MLFERRIDTGPGWRADMTPRGLRWHGASGIVQRRVRGDVPTPSTHITVTTTPDASQVWVGGGDGKVYALGAHARGRPELLEGQLSDVRFWDGRLWGAETGGSEMLKRLVWRTPASMKWEEQKVPRAVTVKGFPSFSLKGHVSEEPDQVALFGSRWGLAVVEKGRGLVTVVRPGGGDLFGLKLQPGAVEDCWFAHATAEGVLVAMVANHRASAVAHVSEAGKHLGLVTHLGGEVLWGLRGLIELDEPKALVLADEGVLQLELPSLAVARASTYEVSGYVTAAPLEPGSWLLAPQDNPERTYLLRASPGAPVDIEELPRTKVSDGEPLWDVGYASPVLAWLDPQTPELTVAAPTTETWSRSFTNQGKPTSGVRVTVRSALLESRLVEITSLRVGERTEPARRTTALVWTAEFTGLAVDPGASVPVSVVFRGRGEGKSEVQLQVTPHVGKSESPGRPCSDTFLLQLE